MKARVATAADFPVIFALAERGYSESRYGRYPLRHEKFERLLKLAEEDALLLIVAEIDEEIVGFVCGIVTEHYFADMVYSTNLAIYVAPEHRGRQVGRVIIRAFEAESRARGADEIMLGVTFGSGAERTARLYNALGYQTIGALTVKYLGDDHVR